MFETKCIKCGEESLHVIAGTFTARGMTVTRDGFATTDAREFDTDNEMVSCTECKTLQRLRLVEDDS